MGSRPPALLMRQSSLSVRDSTLSHRSCMPSTELMSATIPFTFALPKDRSRITLIVSCTFCSLRPWTMTVAPCSPSREAVCLFSEGSVSKEVGLRSSTYTKRPGKVLSQ